jgi:hypothetical protein
MLPLRIGTLLPFLARGEVRLLDVGTLLLLSTSLTYCATPFSFGPVDGLIARRKGSPNPGTYSKPDRYKNCVRDGPKILTQARREA